MNLQTALVTGSTSGIGKAIAMRLAADGAHVVITGRNETRAQAVVDAIRRNGGKADYVIADIADSTGAVRDLANQAVALLNGRIDILVNNAGTYPVGPTVSVEDKDLESLLAVNIRAPHVLVATLAPIMIRQGSGTIINIGSWMGSVGIPISALYGATKVAIEQMSRSWASEFGQLGIRVNSIAPGITLTEGNEHSKAVIDEMVKTTPAGRSGTPDDIANAVAFLVSDEASFIHAATLTVDGGISATKMS